jgi:hypothetical protein
MGKFRKLERRVAGGKKMYQPGMITDRQLAQVRYSDFMDEAAQERANRKTQTAGPKAASRKLVLALAGVAPIAVWMVWMWVGH